MPLTAIQAKEAKPGAKDYKLADEKGLFLLVKNTGRKYWRMKYRYDGKERKLSLGVYPRSALKKHANFETKPESNWQMVLTLRPKSSTRK